MLNLHCSLTVAFVSFLIFPIFSRISMAQEGWYSIPASDPYSHQGIFFVNADTGYVTTEMGGVLVTVDGGSHWADVGPDDGWHGQDVFFLDGKIGWTAQWDTRVYRTTDGGGSWSLQISDTTDQNVSLSLLYSVCFADENVGYAVGGKYDSLSDHLTQIIKTMDGGSHWVYQTVGLQDFFLFDVYFINEDTGWTVGENGRVFGTQDGGSHWVAQASNTSAILWSVSFRSASVGWVVGGGGTLLKTLDGGTSWIQQNNPSPDELRSVCFPTDSVGYACGDNGTILKSTDGGVTWQQQVSGTAEGLCASSFVSPDTGYVAGWDGTILKTVSGGITAVRDGANKIPQSTELMQNYPNPFNPSTNIYYQLATNGIVILKVYDVLGREVATLVNARQSAGNHSVIFDAVRIPSGVYFYTFQVGSYHDTKKLLVLK